ncbi:hypothetical protein FRC04_001246 [Tulasnella sp. 424]|nr:hypothetical protein FRC04_001246 [Tulasnella sp. 424]KAG8969618.1 hypothetical protein FRC05_001049 [Tulasnella sp. 425]
MVLTIIGIETASCTRRVKVVLFEKGVDFVIKPINFAAAEHKSEAHLEKQPFGQIPVLDDDGFILFQSRAIGRYIAAKYADQGTKLLPDPKDLKAVALFEQAACVEQADFDPSASGIVVEKIVNPFKGLPSDENKFQKHVETLNAKIDGYERMLTKHKYLAGDEITLADLWHLPFGEEVEKFAPQIFESHPKFNAWWQALKSRPSWIKANEKNRA